MNEQVCAVILAVGNSGKKGSGLPTALREVLFKPMIQWALDTVEQSGIRHVCTVVSGNSQELEALLDGRSEIFVCTAPPDEGHVIRKASPFYSRFSDVLVLRGDTALIDPITIRASYDCFMQSGRGACLVSGQGQALRNEKSSTGPDASEKEQPPRNLGAVAFWVPSSLLSRTLRDFKASDRQENSDLAGLASLLTEKGCAVYESSNPDMALRAGDNFELLKLNESAKNKILRSHMENGVEFVSLDGILIGPDVKIGASTRILPGTILKGNTTIGEGCTIGPNSLVENSVIGNRTVFNASQMFEGVLGSEVKVGPYCHLRPGSRLEDRVKVGDFVEIKNSVIGEKTSLAHLTYIGDSDIGRGINFGGGCITCNYDGKRKYRTVVEDKAFIGCNTNLVAPVKVGEGAFIAAGSTITEDVEPYALAVARGRQAAKPGWAKKWFEDKK